VCEESFPISERKRGEEEEEEYDEDIFINKISNSPSSK
jgi:hypothetical protein